MNAKDRAEARRKAILARGGDRLAKLTTSARGEDAPAYMHDDPPLAPLPNRPTLEQFVGEQATLPTPSATASAPRTTRGRAQPEPTQSNDVPPPVYEEDPMKQLQEMFAAAGNGTQIPSLPGTGDDPLSLMMANMAQANGMPSVAPQKVAVVKPKTRLQKLLPFIHLLAAWSLLSYFILWREPESYESQTHRSGLENMWTRWAELVWKKPEDGWGVQPVPFFWAFTTLTLVLHSWRVLTKIDTPELPMLLALALPHLPPPLPSIIRNGLAYLRIVGMFLDDIAGLIVGLGLLIWVASWLAA